MSLFLSLGLSSFLMECQAQPWKRNADPNQCSGWKEIESGVLNFDGNGLYCQKNVDKTQANFKCNDPSDAFTIIPCPADMKMDNKKSPDEKASDVADECASGWSKLYKGNSINVGDFYKASSGTFCIKNNFVYKKCNDPNPENNINLIDCPTTVDNASEASQDQDMSDLMENLSELSENLSESSDESESNTWDRFDKDMKALDQKIRACPSWKKHNGNSVSQSGLYCQKNSNGSIYECDQSSEDGISMGDCPSDVDQHVVYV